MTDAPSLDDETRAALALFNQHLAAEEEAEKATRAVRRAEQHKDEAAARLRNLKQADAPAAEVAEAEAAYRAALARLQTIRDGGDPDAGQAEDAAGQAAGDAAEEPAAEDPSPESDDTGA